MSGEAQLEALLRIINTSARQAIAQYKKGGNDVPTIHSRTYHPIDSSVDTVSLRKAVRLLEGACQQLCASLAPPQHTIHNYVLSFEWACVATAVHAKVADVLVEYPNGLHVNELARLINLEEGKIARVLRLLAAKGCFIEVAPNTFVNNRISLVTISTSYTGALWRMETDGVSQGAAALYETMMDSECANTPLTYALNQKGVVGNFFDSLRDAENQKNFNRAMVGLGDVIGSLSVLHHYPWNEVKTFCDVGAGIGAISLPLSKMYPHLKITNQDLPEVLMQAKEVWATDTPGALENKQVEFVPFNFFEESPVQGQDVYYLRQIIHDWPDAEAATIMRNVRKAMDHHSRLLIHDYVLTPACRDPNPNSELLGLDIAPEPLLPNFGNGRIRQYQQDLNMWMKLNGKERTLDELTALGSMAGLSLEKVYDLAESAVLEFRVSA